MTPSLFGRPRLAILQPSLEEAKSVLVRRAIGGTADALVGWCGALLKPW